MKRIIDQIGLVHFTNDTNPELTFCGVPSDQTYKDLLGVHHKPMLETTNAVTCPSCARLMCAAKNLPFNAVRDDVLLTACYDAVK